jgi:hypothetical protein
VFKHGTGSLNLTTLFLWGERQIYWLDNPIKAKLLRYRGVLEETEFVVVERIQVQVTIPLDSIIGFALNLGLCDLGQVTNFSGPQFSQLWDFLEWMWSRFRRESSYLGIDQKFGSRSMIFGLFSVESFPWLQKGQMRVAKTPDDRNLKCRWLMSL